MTARFKRRPLAIGLLGMAAAACAEPDPPQGLQCRRVPITDEAGAPIRGPEDLAWDERNERLLVSAYDRRAVEAHRGASPPPEGGVYALELSDMASRAWRLTSVTKPFGSARGWRPHGLAVGDDGAIHVINRGYVRDGARWRRRVALATLSAGRAQHSPVNPAANDVVTRGGEILYSFDHGAGPDWREELTNARTSGVARLSDDVPLFSGAAFANGLAVDEGGLIFLAATRERAILQLTSSGGGADHIGRKEGPVLRVAKRNQTRGGPDNITIAANGDLLAALHPSLIRLAAARKFGVGRPGSRLARIDPQSGEATTLFEDLEGRLYSAATSVVETPAGLVAGSVLEDALLVCDESRPHERD